MKEVRRPHLREPAVILDRPLVQTFLVMVRWGAGVVTTGFVGADLRVGDGLAETLGLAGMLDLDGVLGLTGVDGAIDGFGAGGTGAAW